jgi:hypothetical protein
MVAKQIERTYGEYAKAWSNYGAKADLALNT